MEVKKVTQSKINFHRKRTREPDGICTMVTSSKRQQALEFDSDLDDSDRETE